MPSKLVLESSERMAMKQMTIAFAESATAGRLAAEYSLVPLSGKILKGGLVCYDAGIKEDILKVSVDSVTKFTPESSEVTKEMAMGLKKVIDAGIVVAITGLTTPGGSENALKPVGTMFIHAIIGQRHIAIREEYKGEAEEIVMQTVDRVARMILDELK